MARVTAAWLVLSAESNVSTGVTFDPNVATPYARLCLRRICSTSRDWESSGVVVLAATFAPLLRGVNAFVRWFDDVA
jgi:hypothetical protein